MPLGETNDVEERFDALYDAMGSVVMACPDGVERTCLWQAAVLSQRQVIAARFRRTRSRDGVEKAKYKLETVIGELKLLDIPEWGKEPVERLSTF